MSSPATPSSVPMETFRYDDAITRKFVFATLTWAVVGMLVGILIALQLLDPAFNLGLEWTSFGRLRPLHTNAVIFAFAGNGIFAAIYYSSQRLLKTRMFSDALGAIHFWGWQLIIVSAAITLPFGFTSSKEYAELEWPIDVAITLVWVVFAINFFGTIYKRRERHIYVAIWFYIATILAIAVLHIGNSLAMPAGILKSYSIYAGTQDAFMQWWYGHNAVAFFLTTPFLGLMYYFLPKAAGRPVFSYRLSIVHFWTIVFLYIWAGPHHLHYSPTPEWASSLGMLLSIMLWMPSWGGMLNGLLTLRGAWDKVAKDPILKFYVVGVTFYGMSTFEGPLLSVKTVNALSHFTDWTIAHVHAGALGWNGMMLFGMVYWLAPRIFQVPAGCNRKLMETHFWMGTVGILLYVVAIYGAGLTQGLMWRAFDDQGSLVYQDFLETVTKLLPMYAVRVVGGTLYLGGVLLGCYNVFMVWTKRPSTYDEPVFEAPALAKDYVEPKAPPGPLDGQAVTKTGQRLAFFAGLRWHRAWEGQTLKFSAWVLVAVLLASAFEMVPLFLRKKVDTPIIAAVKPVTPLELMGRDIYQAEGCVNCHSQMIRPLRSEVERYGPYSKPGEYIYEHPFLWGSRRIGPDLSREGVSQPSALWHVQHLEDPQITSEGSLMPEYDHLLDQPAPFDGVAGHMRALAAVGVPYTDFDGAAASARAQAKLLAERLSSEGGTYYLAEPFDPEKPAEQQDPEAPKVRFEESKMVALVAYLMRLGTDVAGTSTASTGL
ncbi:MAG: cytochrome-c oxidase, cbb3-type subunit I [Planctomycetota bacterium]|nr:cytochrome-c oxidase, cbb3-type subunit I [Planctomycetota bacterium]